MCFFCQERGGIRNRVASRGLGDVYKRQMSTNKGGEKLSTQKYPKNFRPPSAAKSMIIVLLEACFGIARRRRKIFDVFARLKRDF